MAISRVGQVLIANGKAVGLSHFSSSVVFFLWHPFISTQENVCIVTLSATANQICFHILIQLYVFLFVYSPVGMCVNKTIFSMFNKVFKLKIYQ